MENQSPDLLQDFDEELRLQRVPTGTRFLNYIIDMVGYYIIIALVAVGITISASDHGEIRAADTGSESFSNIGLFYLTFFLYYMILEGLTKGKTLGKLITGTRAVKEDGSKIDWKDAALRTLSRLVPFEPFSAFGGFPWHDRWTKTMVIKK